MRVLKICETDAAPLLLFSLTGYFYFFPSQKSLVLLGNFPLLTILFPTLNAKVLCTDLKAYNVNIWTKLRREKLEQITIFIPLLILSNKRNYYVIKTHPRTISLDLWNNKNNYRTKVLTSNIFARFPVCHTHFLSIWNIKLLLLISSFLSLSLPLIILLCFLLLLFMDL